ncbi:unnamed protein product, partial [Rotaria sp. Silwood1]
KYDLDALRALADDKKYRRLDLLLRRDDLLGRDVGDRLLVLGLGGGIDSRDDLLGRDVGDRLLQYYSRMIS